MAFKSDLDALILGVLQDGALHGYEIAKRIRSHGSAALKVGEGQLYPTLHKLEENGFVRSSWAPQEGKPPRKVYELTEIGKAELAIKKQAWETFMDGVSAVLTGKSKEAYNG